MFILWRRYSRSGYAPWWFYLLMAVGFAALAAWAIIEGAWLVAGLALAMLPVVILAIALTRRLNQSAQAPRDGAGKDGQHE